MRIGVGKGGFCVGVRVFCAHECWVFFFTLWAVVVELAVGTFASLGLSMECEAVPVWEPSGGGVGTKTMLFLLREGLSSH